MAGMRASICDESQISPGTWESWFPYYGHLLQPVVLQCFQQLHDYPQNNSALIDVTSIPDCPGVANLITCVQNTLPSAVTLAMASAQVILGLAPTIISSLSSSVAEISMLSSNRPILSLMLTLGSPSVHTLRFLEFDNPIAILKKPTKRVFAQKRVLQPTFRHACISIIQYLLVLAAIANVLHLDWQLGYQTICMWMANRPFLVYLWSVLAIVPHALSAFSCYFSKTMREERERNRQQRIKQNKTSGGALGASFKREVTICAAKARRGYLEHQQEEPEWVVYLNILAGTTSYVLFIYGTMVFSSLLFIGPTDAFWAIYRYLGSTLVCRGVLVYELSGIVAVETSGQATDALLSARGLRSHEGAPTFGSTEDTVMSSDDVKQPSPTVIVVRRTSAY